MLREKKTELFFEKVLDKMFQAVGFEGFDKEFVKDPNWFSKKAWGEKAREEFKLWFIQSARKELRWSKTLAEKEFSHFDFMYGWSLHDKEWLKHRSQIVDKMTKETLTLN